MTLIVLIALGIVISGTLNIMFTGSGMTETVILFIYKSAHSYMNWIYCCENPILTVILTVILN